MIVEIIGLCACIVLALFMPTFAARWATKLDSTMAQIQPAIAAGCVAGALMISLIMDIGVQTDSLHQQMRSDPSSDLFASLVFLSLLLLPACTGIATIVKMRRHAWYELGPMIGWLVIAVTMGFVGTGFLLFVAVMD